MCGEKLTVFDNASYPIAAQPLAWALGGAALLVLVVLLRRFVPLLVLFTRLSKRDITEHPSRTMLLALIRATPGVATATLARESKLAQGTLDYHLRTLEKAMLVKSLLAGRDRVWFEAGAKRPPLPEHASRVAILDAARSSPGLSKSDLARRLDLTLPTVHHHVKGLEGAGALDVRRDGAAMRVFPRFDLAPHPRENAELRTRES